MRIIINLSMFFRDHRSIARIFLNEKILTIKDVQQRISTIFQIHDFYLMSENHFLPCCEDVNILNYDDVVWVLPLEKQVQPFESDQPEPIKTKKKKAKDKKKRKLEEEERSEEINLSSPKRKKIHNETSERQPIAQFKEINGQASESNELDKSITVKALVNSFENKITDIKCHGEFVQPKMVDPSQFKKVNIVKTIIVSKGCNSTPIKSDNSFELEFENTPPEKLLPKNDSRDNSLNNPEPKIKPSSEDMSNTSFKSMSLVSDDVIETSDDSTTNITTCSETSKTDNVTKRRRTRIRKRKNKNSCNNVFVPSTPFPTPANKFIPTSVSRQSLPSVHVRFDESVNTLDNGHATNELSLVQKELVKVVSNEDDTKPNNSGVQTNGQDNEVTEEFIEKHPITADRCPRVSDIIGFKILRMSENYIPQLSSSIVGQVVTFDSDSKEIVLDISHGHDQCLEPQGKFSLASDEGEEADTNQPGSIREHFLWTNLHEPRLLFP